MMLSKATPTKPAGMVLISSSQARRSSVVSTRRMRRLCTQARRMTTIWRQK